MTADDPADAENADGALSSGETVRIERDHRADLAKASAERSEVVDSAPTLVSLPLKLEESATSPMSEPRIPQPDPGVQTNDVRQSTRPDDLLDSGELLVNRYRLIRRLGEGGMGEVFLAEDKKLQERVAVKILPRSLQLDGKALARFHREVRVARQVAHQNVVRVFDIGEQDGMHFLTMECIDGEDLSQRLARTGPLPPEEAIAIALQICSGLAAAHRVGVLHRDLKPANIIVDGSGHAKITDFGIAALSDDLTTTALMGTPAYMAPEQMRGEPCFASDIYALGLVIYELLAGELPFCQARSVTELMVLQERESPPSLSHHVEGLDPVVEQVVLRCLDRDPTRRPQTPLDVAAALPGGDPLAAAVAAGETPSPEMVVQAHTEGGFSRTVAATLYGSLLVALLLSAHMADRGSIQALDGLPLSPDVLADRARTLLHDVGSQMGNKHFDAFGFDQDEAAVDRLQAAPGTLEQIQQLAANEARAFDFWYRAAPEPLVPLLRFRSRPSFHDPPRSMGRIATILYDSHGRLLYFDEALQTAGQQVMSPDTANLDETWDRLLDETGLFERSATMAGSLQPAEPAFVPPVPFDRRFGWTGVAPDSGAPLHIEAATLGGAPVYFEVVRDNDFTPGSPSPAFSGAEVVQLDPRFVSAMLLLFVFTLIASSILAARNWRRGRAHTRGALVLALLAGGTSFVAWVLYGYHTATAGEVQLFVQALALAVFKAGAVALLYLALEPQLRRHWPHGLISWGRLLEGRFRDPLVCRDVLVSFTIGAITVVLLPLIQDIAGLRMGRGLARGFDLHSAEWKLLGFRYALGYLFELGTILIASPLVGALLYVSVRRLVRNRVWPTRVAAFAVILGVMALEGGLSSWAILIALTTVFVMERYGLLAIAGLQLTAEFIRYYPISADPSHWWTSSGLVGMAVVVAIATWSLWVCLHSASQRQTLD